MFPPVGAVLPHVDPSHANLASGACVKYSRIKDLSKTNQGLYTAL